LYEKLARIMDETSHVLRDKRIEMKSGQGYNVTTEAAVLEMIRPLLVREKLLYFPIDAQVQLVGNVAVATCKYKFVDSETGESEIIGSIGAGHDTSDKHAGKAMTYAGKYGLLKTFNLITTDDPDLASSDQNNEADKKQVQKAAASISTKAELMDYLGLLQRQGKITGQQGAALFTKASAIPESDVEQIRAAAAYFVTL